jgi:hypothetical protein
METSTRSPNTSEKMDTRDTLDNTWVGRDWLLSESLLSEKLDLVVQVRNPHGTQKDTTNVALYYHSPSRECPSK